MLHAIDETRTEMLHRVPAQLRVKVIRRPRYGCRACAEAVVQAPAPARLIEGGLPTEAAVAHVVVAKYADHLPLYRQARSTPVRGSTWTGPHWRTGLVMLLGTCARRMRAC